MVPKMGTMSSDGKRGRAVHLALGLASPGLGCCWRRNADMNRLASVVRLTSKRNHSDGFRVAIASA